MLLYSFTRLDQEKAIATLSCILIKWSPGGGEGGGAGNLKRKLSCNQDLMNKNTNHSLPGWRWPHVVEFPHVIVVRLKGKHNKTMGIINNKELFWKAPAATTEERLQTYPI